MNAPQTTQGRNVAAFRNGDFTVLFVQTGLGLLCNDPRFDADVLAHGLPTDLVGDHVVAALARSTVLSAADMQALFKSGDVQRHTADWERAILERARA